MRTLDHVDAALAALAPLEAEAATLRTEQAAELASLQGEVIAKRADRLRELTSQIDAKREQIARWAERSMAEHLPEGSRTLTLPHGTLALRKSRDRVDFAPEHDEAKVLERIKRRFPIATTLAGIMSRAWNALKLSDVIRVKLTIDRTAALKAAANGATAALRDLGLQVVTGQDELTIEASPR